MNREKLIYFVLCLVCAGGLLTAQTIQLNLDPATSCNFDGSQGESGPVYGFDSSREAEDAVKDILRQVGLPQNFMIKAANIPNAQAHVSQGERYILYSQRFMDDIFNQTGDYWSKVAVLAHEIGHHLLGHTLKDDGSRPVKELDADKWSGFVLYKMGASLPQAQLAAQTLASRGGSATHPPRAARMEAIAVGYNEARELAGDRQPTPRSNVGAPANTTVEVDLKKANSFYVREIYSEAFPLFHKHRFTSQFSALDQVRLGYMYENGYGVKQNYEEASVWYRKSAEQGNSDGQLNLGFLYEKGNGVRQNYDEAAKWYRRSAEQGNAQGQANIGVMYEKGYGVTQDYYEAVKWFRRSADQGNAHGQNNLGVMYHNGTGVRQDHAEARRLYQKAADQGHQVAIKNLKLLSN